MIEGNDGVRLRSEQSQEREEARTWHEVDPAPLPANAMVHEVDKVARAMCQERHVFAADRVAPGSGDVERHRWGLVEQETRADASAGRRLFCPSSAERGER